LGPAKEKVLVTGGTGFVGTNLVSILEKRKVKIRLLTRHRKTSFPPSASIEITQADLEKKLSPKIFDGVECVFHFASFVPKSSSEDRAAKARAGNITATKNLFKALEKTLVKQVVFASTAEVYGIPSQIPVSEKSRPRPRSNYAKTKLQSEKIALEFAARKKIPVAILRFTTLYGPGDESSKAIPSFTKAAIEGKPLSMSGSGKQKRDYLFVGDAAHAAMLAWTRKANGVFNIGGPGPISIGVLAKKITAIARSRSKTIHSTADSKEYDFTLDWRKAKKTFGFKPRTSLDAGIKKVLEWQAKKSRR